MLKQALKTIFTSNLKYQNQLIKPAANIVSTEEISPFPNQRTVSGMVATVEELGTKSAIGGSESVDGGFDADAINGLIESYSLAQKDLSNKWLSYLKNCHVYLYRGGGKPSNSLASFDLDGTIIKPKSNKRIPRNATDWQFFSVWTKVKIQQAIRENESRLVIFTNQNGVGLRLVALEEVQERVELVTQRLNIPCTVFVAIEKDGFRKPNTGMFKLFEEAFNDNERIDLGKSFYCGDAVGYPSHSDADIKFAQTLRLPFLPPEKFLRGVKPKLVEERQNTPKADA